MAGAGSARVRTIGSGEVVRGYRIVRSVGEGPVGFIFVAEVVATHLPCAIEFVRVADPTGAHVAKLRRSATLVASLRDPRLVEVLGAFAWDEEMLALATELAGGEPLSTLLARDGPLALEHAVELTHQVAGALAKAHAQGFVHGHLTPRCIWLAPAGLAVRLLGLGTGFLRTLVHAPERSPFDAPELARGEIEASTAADVYALAGIARACLTNPLAGTSEQLPLRSALLAALETAHHADAQRRPSMAVLASTFAELGVEVRAGRSRTS
jgi:serine/threonine-protein kinase